MELLATVHWVATREGASDPQAAVDVIYAWSPRKRRFSPAQIELALRVLRDKNWLGTG
jgi:hypothetical protein